MKFHIYREMRATGAVEVTYPVLLQPQPEGGYCVTFRDIPEAITQGDSEEQALKMAADALRTAFVFYDEDARPLPAPSPRMPGEYLVSVSYRRDPVKATDWRWKLTNNGRQIANGGEGYQRLPTMIKTLRNLFDGSKAEAALYEEIARVKEAQALRCLPK